MVEVSVIVIKGNKVLLGESSGWGTWDFPRAYLDLNGKSVNHALRRVEEETGLEVELIDESPVLVTNNSSTKENEHYVMKVRHVRGNPDGRANWFDWYKMPPDISSIVKDLTKGYNPFRT